MFCEDGFCWTTQEFSLYIDTGNHPTIYYKPLRYAPHESKFMQNLMVRLDGNAVAEEDNGPLEDLLVLASKLHQENVPWNN